MKCLESVQQDINLVNLQIQRLVLVTWCDDSLQLPDPHDLLHANAASSAKASIKTSSLFRFKTNCEPLYHFSWYGKQIALLDLTEYFYLYRLSTRSINWEMPGCKCGTVTTFADECWGCMITPALRYIAASYVRLSGRKPQPKCCRLLDDSLGLEVANHQNSVVTWQCCRPNTWVVFHLAPPVSGLSW